MTSHNVWPLRRPTATDQPRRPTTRVMIRASDPLVAAGLLAMLGPAPGIEVVADANDAEVTVAVADGSLEGLLTPGIDRLILIADELRQAELWAAIEHGLLVLVPRAEATVRTRLIRAIADARAGRGDLPAEQLGAVLQGLKRLQENILRPRDFNLTGLSQRETEMIRLLADGLDTSEIAVKLIYSERTVKNTLHALLSRLNLRNRAHAVAYALQHGLI